jgi:hypothetical protein
MDSGIELNAVVVGTIITVVTTVAADRTSAIRHRCHFYPASQPINISFGSSQGKVVLYHEDKKKNFH